MARLTGLVLLFAHLVFCSVTQVSYDGFQAFRVPTGEDAQTVDALISRFNLDTWKYTWSFADVLVPPHHIDALTNEIQVAGLNATVLDQDVGASIAAGPITAAGKPLHGDEDVWLDEWFDDYHHIKDHWTWMNTLANRYPLNVKLMDFGNSTDDAPIQVIQLRLNATSGETPKPAVVFHGTVHAREWITAMVVEYAALQLLDKCNVGSNMWNFDYYFLPIVNPDGFLYSQEQDRMWRKNREINDCTRCMGVDLNRHWPHMWDVVGGGSDQPCSETFKGFSPAASTETQSLIRGLEWIQQTHGNISLYIDWHSYSQVILSPYGYSCKKQAKNHEVMQSLMKGAVEAFRKPYGTRFGMGPICKRLYQVSGSSVDYAYDVMQAHNAFTVELRPQHRFGSGGFLLPREQIRPSAVEAWEGIKYLVEHL